MRCAGSSTGASGTLIPRLYPFATRIHEPSVLNEGFWLFGKPIGVTIHHTADRDLARVLADGVSTRVGYHLIIDRDAETIQTAYFNQPIEHAGDAMWNGHSPNRNHIAIALLGWGAVEIDPPAFKAWNGSFCAFNEVSQRPGNLSPDLQYWDAATQQQEDVLMIVLKWLLAQGIDPANICGHDECALPRGRKDDPGGTLSMTMSELRERLAKA